MIDMIKRNPWVIAAILALAISCFAFKGCNEKQLRVTSAVIVAGSDEAIKTEKDFANAGVIAPEVHARLEPALSNINNAARAFDKFLKANPKLRPETKAEALQLAGKVIDQLDSLDRDGVIHFKDEKKELTFRLILTSARTSLSIAQNLIEQEPLEAAPSPTP
jgi:hypothetical protein